MSMVRWPYQFIQTQDMQDIDFSSLSSRQKASKPKARASGGQGRRNERQTHLFFRTFQRLTFGMERPKSLPTASPLAAQCRYGL